MGGDFLDIHAALAGRHQRYPLGGAVHHHADVEFLPDVGTLFHQQALDQSTLRSGLMGDQRHAENFSRVVAHFVQGLGDLYAAALAAATGVDLRLHHPYLAAELFGRLHRFVHGKARHAARCGHTVLAQDFLTLVFVNVHAIPLF